MDARCREMLKCFNSWHLTDRSDGERTLNGWMTLHSRTLTGLLSGSLMTSSSDSPIAHASASRLRHRAA